MENFAPRKIVADKFRSYPVAIRALRLPAVHDRWLRANNEAENSHLPVRRRERKRSVSSRRVRHSVSSRFNPPPKMFPTTNAIFSIGQFTNGSIPIHSKPGSPPLKPLDGQSYVRLTQPDWVNV